jgi:sarcosine/dimethylglycine N-methyltransferase
MRHDDRHAFDLALEPARSAAYPPGGFVGQESFMCADEILRLAASAGIGAGTRVLDLCCGVAGPGRLVTAETGCDYVGVDASPAAVRLARKRAAGLSCRFETALVPPVPDGAFDVVLLLETMLAFRDKAPLLHGIADVLEPGGRFACTVEEGLPLSEDERAAMPDADTVWLIPFAELNTLLERAGFGLRWTEDRTFAHRQVAERLTAAFLDDRRRIAAVVGGDALDDLVAAHRLWIDWLRRRRVRKIAVVAERLGRPG